MLVRDLKVLKVEYLVTRSCKLQCRYCKITDIKSLRGAELPLERVEEVIDFLQWYWPGAPLIIFGGEPTDRDDLPEIIAYAASKGMKTAVISNSRRVMGDEAYAERLVAAGLDNWSVSYDGEVNNMGDLSVVRKSSAGLSALRMFRDDYGIRDLVACITVTKYNIMDLPKIVHRLSSEGVWSICTPLQVGDPNYTYDYSSGSRDDLPTQEQVEEISLVLSKMAHGGRYLMHNDASWFDAWPGNFLAQNWMCSNKATLTIDADGSLRWCVDQALPEDFTLFDLEVPENLERYAEILKDEVPHCGGCFWDPAYESVKRGLDTLISEADGRKSYRHELSPGQVEQLIPEARKWFKK